MANFAVARGQAPNSDTTQDITSSGFGTPTAAVVICSYATALDTNTADAIISIGFYDGTTQECVESNSEDAQAASNCNHSHTAAKVLSIRVPGSSTVIREATAAFITDGVRLTWTGGNTNQYQVTVWLFNDVGSVSVESYVPNASTTPGTWRK